MSQAGFDVRYGQIDLASQVILSDVGPAVAFAALEQPVPVGCKVALVHGEVQVPATVIRSVEAVKGRATVAGIWVRVELDDQTRPLWEPLVVGDDPAIPEPAGQRAVENPESADRIKPSESASAEADEAAADEAAAGEAAADAPAADEPAVSGSTGERSRSGSAKQTQVMSAVDIREVLGHDPLDDAQREAGAPEAGADAGHTQPIGSGMLDGSAAPASGKKKKKRKRRKTR